MHLRRLAALCAALPLVPALLAAQEVRGRVTTSGSARPGGALVELLDAQGRPAASAATDSSGAFRVRAPGAGRYQLRAGQVGYRSVQSAPFSLGEGEQIDRSLAITARAVTLEGVRASARRRCQATPTSGEALAQVWEEARKALVLTARTAADSSLAYDAATYLRTTRTRTDSILEDSMTVKRVVGAIPFASAPIGDLDLHGFVRNSAGRTVYFGPDAEVLLSDRFLSRHCFSLRRGEGANAGMIGLAFQPLPGGIRPDVSGVLWLDAKSSELRRLDWGYTHINAPTAYAPRGRADFVRLPGGAWIISSWRLRIPNTVPRVSLASGKYALHYSRVPQVREMGGSVVRVYSVRRDGEP
jgi:hypothetical protein